MKPWKKSKTKDFGSLLLSWRHKNSDHFGTRILTWLLTGFVLALLASIVMKWIGAVTLAQPLAQIIFFVTVLFGIVDSYFYNVVLGTETRLYQTELVQVQPPLGLEWLAFLTGRPLPSIGYKFESLPLSMIKSAQQEKNELQLNLKEEKGVVSIPVMPVISYRVVEGDRESEYAAPGNRYRFGSKDSKFSSQVMGTILAALKEAKRHSGEKS